MSARPPLRIAAIEIDGTVTRPLHLDHPFGETLFRALKEAMLKRGCLRDWEHKGQCLDCALVPQCAVWPLVAPGDPTRRQRGAYLRPFVLRIPMLPSRQLAAGTRLTWGATIVQDTRFPAKWGAFVAALVDVARQLAEWGIGAPVRAGEQASRRGAISVGRVHWVQPLTGATEPYVSADDLQESLPLAVAWSEGATPASVSADIRMTFLTPTRLVAAGKSSRSPEPLLLIRRIAERLDAVAEAVGAESPNLLANDTLLSAAGRIAIAKDETRWEGDPARGGFVGAVTLSGTANDLAAVLPALHWGAALGVGKGTLEGAGRFILGDMLQTARATVSTRAAVLRGQADSGNAIAPRRKGQRHGPPPRGKGNNPPRSSRRT